MGDEQKIRCPDCHSDAYYKYGKTQNGERRYQCLICGRQFTLNSTATIKDRPLCPKCGNKMHVYMRSADKTRFRCSEYPDCKTYETISLERTWEDVKLISEHFEIREFIEPNKDKTWEEFLSLLDLEATKAERVLYKKAQPLSHNREKIEEYVKALKILFRFMKSSVSLPKFGIDPLFMPYLEGIKSTRPQR